MKVSFPRVIHKKIRKKNNEFINIIQFNEIYVEENESKLRDLLFLFWHYFQFPVTRQ